MASARDEREAMLTGRNATQRSLMDRRNQLAATETPSLLGQLGTQGGIATGLAALLAGLAGEKEAAASLVMGGLGGAAEAVTAQETAKAEAVKAAEMDVYDQINKDQDRALQIMNVDPEAFFQSAPNSAAANAELGLSENFDLVGVYSRRRAKADRDEKAKQYYATAITMAETPEEKYAVTKRTFDALGVEYSEEELRELARENVTYAMVEKALTQASPASRTKVMQFYAEQAKLGRGVNDAGLNSEAMGLIEYIGEPIKMDAAGYKQANLAEVIALRREAETLANREGVAVEYVLNPDNNMWPIDKQVRLRTLEAETGTDKNRHYSMYDAVASTIDLGAVAEKARQEAEAYNKQVETTNKEGRFSTPMRPIGVESYVAAATQGAYNNAMEALYGAKVDAGRMTYWRVMDGMADSSGVVLSDLMNNPALFDSYRQKAIGAITEFGAEYDELLRQRGGFGDVIGKFNDAAKEYDKDPTPENAAAWQAAARDVKAANDAERAASVSKSAWVLAKAGSMQQEAPPFNTNAETVGDVFGPTAPATAADAAAEEEDVAIGENVLPEFAAAEREAAAERKVKAAEKAAFDKEQQDRVALEKKSIADRTALTKELAAKPALHAGWITGSKPDDAKARIVDELVKRLVSLNTPYPGAETMTREDFYAKAQESYDAATKLVAIKVRGGDIVLPDSPQEQIKLVAKELGLIR